MEKKIHKQMILNADSISNKKLSYLHKQSVFCNSIDTETSEKNDDNVWKLNNTKNSK